MSLTLLACVATTTTATTTATLYTKLEVDWIINQELCSTSYTKDL